jgi:phosphonate degradation associated HDIG domain protein
MPTLEQATQFLSTIEGLFASKGELRYGEEVSQIQHALQCGHMAEQDGATEALVVAAVLHDVGHMIHRDAAHAVDMGRDDHHEALGARWLLRFFPESVTEPIRLHVQAKRYLCLRDPVYEQTLSDLSRTTLQIQGGVMSWGEALEFEGWPHAMDAVQLRRWDDKAKLAHVNTPDLSHFLAKARALCVFTQSPSN